MVCLGLIGERRRLNQTFKGIVDMAATLSIEPFWWPCRGAKRLVEDISRWEEPTDCEQVGYPPTRAVSKDPGNKDHYGLVTEV